MPVSVRKFYSEWEYLEMERLAKSKSEFFRGEIFAMSGASYEHNQVTSNLMAEVLPYLKEKPCKMFGSDLRIHIQENTLYTYPDATIICGKPAFTDDSFDTVVNPSVIFEILSASTRHYDLTTKFNFYKAIPSLKEYVTIDSQSCAVVTYCKMENGSWDTTYYNKMDEQWHVRTIAYSGIVGGLYADVDFSRKPS